MTIQGRFPVLANEKVAEETWQLTVLCPGIADLAQPGQFLTLRVANESIPLLRRPFGIHRVHAACRGAVDVLYRVVGKGTQQMTLVPRGEQVDLLGPLGHGFSHFPDRALHFLVAGGIGIAPFPLLAQRIRTEQPAAVVRLFFGGRTQQDLAGLDALEPFCDATELTTEDGGRGEWGLVTQPLARALDGTRANAAVIYACGPIPMLAAVARFAMAKGIPCEVSLESQMACGLGTCMGCVTRTIPAEGGGLPATCDPCSTKGVQECYARVCTEGPVFDARVIAWGA